MTTRALTLSSLGFALALALFLHQTVLHIPAEGFPSLPFDPAVMSMDQIILVFGLFPRAVVAMLAGAALGLSGALLQQLLRNPIADPSTLGISAGAQLAIVAATLFAPEVLDGYRSLVALAGAGIATALVFALGWRRAFEPVTMVISGLLISITAGALSAALTLSQGEYLMSLVTWNGGALSQQNWSVATSLAVELAVGAALAALVVRPLVLMGLGDSGARSLGMSLTGVRVGVAVIACSLAAVVAAGVGLVSFVGLAAPALVRALGVRRPAVMLMVAPLAGGLLLWLCDGLVQQIATTTSETFPTGAVTALIGGPMLIWLLPQVRQRAGQAADHAGIIRRRPRLHLLVLLAALPVLALLALSLGKSMEGWTLLTGAPFADLLPLRWPRLLAAGAAGGLLALAGAILQRLTGNAMASPEVLGVSGGAGIGYAAAITLAPAGGAFALFAGAGLGALVVMVIVLAFASQRHLPPERLLLAGIAVSSLASSVLSALLAIGDARSWQILAWLGGSASSATPATALFLSLLAVLALVLSLGAVRWLTILTLGPAVPKALGLPLRASRISMILVAGLATGAASLLVGPLSFVGLVAPHIALRAGFTRAADHLVASFLSGTLLMLLADVGARSVTFPYELPLGLFAALAGAPYLVWLIGRR